MFKKKSSSHRRSGISPFDLPELVEHIASFLSQREMASCLRVNHHLHNILLPLLWRKFCVLLPPPSSPQPEPSNPENYVWHLRDRLTPSNNANKMPDPSTSRVYNRSRDPVLLKSIYKFRPLVQVLHLEFFAGAYLQHFVDSPLYKTPFAQPYNPQASDPKCLPPRGLVSLRIMTGLSQDSSYLAAHDSICPIESILTLVRWNRWLTVLQLPSSLLLSERGVTKFMDILLGATQLQDPEGGVLKSDSARSRPWSRTLSSTQAAAAVATSPLCLQNLESLTIGAEGLKPRSLSYERILITRFVQACCARLPRLHELHLLFIIAYRAQREDRMGELTALEAELASLDLSSTSKASTASENPFALLPSPTIRILTLPRGLGVADSYLGNDLVECTLQNWVKNLDELSVPGYVPEWKDNLKALVKQHHPFLARLDLD